MRILNIKINENNKLDIKEINKKEIMLRLDNVIQKSINDGNIFFSVTINITDEREKNEILKIFNEYCSNGIEF